MREGAIMATYCEMITPLKLSSIESEANSISGILKGLPAAPMFVALTLHSIALYSQQKKYLKHTDLSCFDIESNKCCECLQKIKETHKELLNDYKPIYQKIKKIKSLFISRYIFKKVIETLEDRIEILELSTDPELTKGLTILVDHLKSGTQVKTRDWREALNEL
jgi:hypothetical protein